MPKDVKGYYTALGVSPAATEAEIKAAFRKLAKEHHPDAGRAADGGARFRAMAEAYAVLGDAASRAEYDALSATTTATSREQPNARIDPITCSECGQITAQPRYVVFRQVVSFVIGTLRSPVQGIYCARCAHKKALRATAVSVVAGWWGIPWGPIFTVVESLQNAFGGSSVTAANERLLWHNAVAFGLRGDKRLSLALAEKVMGAHDPEIAAHAANLIEHFQRQGLELGSVLRDPWPQPPHKVLLHLLLIAALPVALVGAIYAGSQGQSVSTAPVTYAGADYPSPPYQADAASSPTQAAAATALNAAPEHTCKHPPQNGKVLTGRKLLRGEGHVIDINNGSAGDAIVKIRYAGSMRSAASFFIQSNQSATLPGIPDGSYVIQYAFGPSLASNCRSFTSIDSAGQFPQPETFTTERIEDELGTRLRWVHLSYTLYSVPGGNIQPNTIDATAFEAEGR